MSDKSGRSVYIGAPEEFATWVGYTVEELLEDPSDVSSTDEVSMSTAEDDRPEPTESEGWISRIFGR
jgi:hypothetical protein